MYPCASLSKVKVVVLQPFAPVTAVVLARQPPPPLPLLSGCVAAVDFDDGGGGGDDASACHAALSGHRGSTTTNVRGAPRAWAALRRDMRCATHAAATSSTKGGFTKKQPLRGRQAKHEPTEPKAASTSPAAEQKVGRTPSFSARMVVFKGLAKSSASRPISDRRHENTAGGQAAWLPPAFSCPPCRAKILAKTQ
eukprot:CAMPEP_0171660740 /NCGR_PEP_ID=MMETSP0990-20121206/44478_1 /TAXON_ID=483369 /ORGANISM="non described non described, Strain CCMP2098" /LENGTH=194 /DNA_ID=CAMNT_0012242705 /DNA_START=366 /DNA_END=950 /DNA_ORIENTATION=+